MANPFSPCRNRPVSNVPTLYKGVIFTVHLPSHIPLRGQVVRVNDFLSSNLSGVCLIPGRCFGSLMWRKGVCHWFFPGKMARKLPANITEIYCWKGRKINKQIYITIFSDEGSIYMYFYITGFAQAWKVLENEGLAWKVLGNIICLEKYLKTGHIPWKVLEFHVSGLACINPVYIFS